MNSNDPKHIDTDLQQPRRSGGSKRPVLFGVPHRSIDSAIHREASLGHRSHEPHGTNCRPGQPGSVPGNESKPIVGPPVLTGSPSTSSPDHFRDLWPNLRQQLLEGTYQPGPVRRKSIPKPDGSERHLGIPNVIDRLIQQAILLVLTPIFDPDFSESSFGFRPDRSAHEAIHLVQKHIRAGYRWCVDMDLVEIFRHAFNTTF